MIEITERFLSDAGGWQALKQARALHDLGRVSSAKYEPPLLQGHVKEGELELRSGLRILSRSNVENLCGCRPARREGVICAHSLAVGLEVLRPRAKSLPAAPIPAEATAPKMGPFFSTESGEPLELSLILPVNFLSAWEKGSIVLGVEALSGGRRTLISALDRARTYLVSAEDEAILEKLRAWNGGDLPGMPMLPQTSFLKLLAVADGHPRVSFGKGVRTAVSTVPLRLTLDVHREPSGALRLSAQVPAASTPLLGNPVWLLQPAGFQALPPGLPQPYQQLLSAEVSLAPEQAEAFLHKELSALRQWFDFELPSGVPDAHDLVEEAVPAFQMTIEGSLNHLAASVRAVYDDLAFTLTNTPPRVASAVRRNLAEEERAVARLQAAGFSGPDAQGQLVLKGEPRILAFFASLLPRLQRDWKVEIGARFQHVTREIDRIQPQLEIRSSSQNWFELKVELATADGDRFSAAHIQRLLQSGQSSVRTRGRKLAVFDPGAIGELQQVLIDCNPEQRQPGVYRIEQRHAAYLDAIANEQGTSLKAVPDWRQAVASARTPRDLPGINLGALKQVLRNYQKEGVSWLNWLSVSGFGGILADEMGLGKTLQALCFLQATQKKGLIVCPSSLVFNWQREAERFTPALRVLAIQGANRRDKFSQIANADLVITSYPLLQRDLEEYRQVSFEVAILDEAQHIKNPETQNAQAANSLRAQHRFVLTGTPVENSVRDLWSLMNFVMPGYLGSRDDFRDRFEKEIQADPGGPVHRRLAKRMQPFMLRRLKSDVAKDLPEKIEQVSYCELTTIQQRIYSDLVGSARRTLSELSGFKDQAKARILVLTALLRLRQACCDLRLLDLAEPPPPDNSAKVELCRELLAEAIDGDHRVLVFSQFVSMLTLLRGVLEEDDISFCYLSGETKDRATQVERFQEGKTPVFLISLKAGGVGLNLTAADTVIHFDPWWNPAVEAQATDRAHRIGQRKVVTSYKLIARNTVEEKILELQTKKRRVIAATVKSEQPMMEALSMEELSGLIS